MKSRKRKEIKPQRGSKRLAFEGLELRRVMVSDWQNPGQVWDVNHDLAVSPIDALQGINRLNSGVSRTFPARPIGSTEPYFDVSGDGVHSPLDVLLVINALNRSLPTVSFELSKDTGVGIGASSDRRTADLSVRGNISRGRATELWGRFAGDANWHLVKTFSPTITDQSFTILHDDLIAAIDELPGDGLVTLQLQPRFGAGNAEVGNEADLPITLDRTPPQSNFEQQPNFLGAISMPLPTMIEIPLNERVSPFTLVASKVKLIDSTFSSSSDAQVLTARGISLSSDGRFLLVEPPTNSQSISYVVSVEAGAFEDLAGNLNIAFEALAHHFNDASQTPLTFGQKIDFFPSQPTVKEYTFDLASPDLFILAGLSSTNEMQLDLFSPSGQIVRNWTTGKLGGSLQLGATNRAMLTEVGEYTLRVAAPVASTISFKALLSKQLSSVPPSSPLQGTFTWAESQAFSLEVTNQDRIYFKNNLNPLTPFRVTLLNQYGQEATSESFEGGDNVFTVPSGGRYVALIESFTATRPISFDYKVHLSQTAKQPLTLGQFLQNTLVTPGQQVFYIFAAQSAHTYTLEIESEFGDVTLGAPGILEVNKQGAFAVEETGDGYVLLAFNRADIPSTSSRFRLVESLSTVTPPSVATVHTQPLTQGVTQRTIQLELESYEFTFTGTTGELFAFKENKPTGDASYELLAPTGSTVQSVEQTDGLRVYRIPYGGQYRLRAFGDVSTELTFQWQQLSAATVLTANAVVQGNISLPSFAAYRFVANSARFFVYPTFVADSLAWKLLDENGRVVGESVFNQDFAADVVSGRAYTLVVEKQGATASEEFSFRRRNPVNSTRNGVVGTATTGNLLARGDRVVIELSLAAGQLVDLTSNLDPALARVRWLDYSINDSGNPRDIDPDVPTLVGSTRKYRVEVQNMSDAAVNYSVKFDAVQKPLTPPGTLVGFDQIHSGNIDGTLQTFTFNATAGSYYMFDWLLEDNPYIQIDITDPSGNIVYSNSASDTSLAIVESDGVLSVRVENFAATTQPFSFRLLSPSTGEVITLGTKKSALVIPFGSTFFRVPLGNTTEVFLQSKLDPNNSTSLYRLGSTDPFGAPFEGPFINGQFLVGDAIVWANNLTAENYLTEFTATNVATLTEVPLNSPVSLQTTPEVTYLLPFKTTVANTVIGAAGIAVVDQAGEFLDPILGGTAFQLKQAGDYRAVFVASNSITLIELHTQVESNAAATLASPMSGTIVKVGDVKRYSIALTSGASILLTLELSANGFAQWIAPNGEVISPIVGGSIVLPVYSTGTYQLEIYSAADATNFLFELNDLSQSIVVTPGPRTGNTGTGLVEVNQLVASPNQLMELQNSSAEQVLLTAIDRLGIPLPQVSFANRLFSQVPADGIVYILVQPLPGKSGVDFAYVVDLVSTTTQAATLGQVITGTLNSRLEGKSYTFTVTQPTWLRVGNSSSNSALLVLKMADGSLRSSPEGFFGLLLAGNYEVGIYNDARSVNNFNLTIDLLSQTPAVLLNQTTTINKAGRYRVDIASKGRFELQLQNSSNAPLEVSDLTITNLNGSEVGFDPRGTLGAGSYWVTFNQASGLPAGDYKLKIASIATTESTLAVNVLGEYPLDVNGLQERLVTIALTPGMRLVVDELELGSGGVVEVRFNNGQTDEWSSIDQLSAIFASATGDETLQFRIRGTGLVRLHVVDLNGAPPLTLGSAISIDLSARRRAQAWLINGNVGDIVDFISDSTTEKPVQWMIIDEAGQIVAKSIRESINFAVVNKQRLALVVVATEPLSNTVNVPFRTVVS